MTPVLSHHKLFVLSFKSLLLWILLMLILLLFFHRIIVPITHFGHTTLNSGSSALKLSNLLCALQLEKKIFSVRQLCQDNHVGVESFPNSLFVENMNTKAIILIGVLRMVSISFPLPLETLWNLLLNKIEIHGLLWYERLGHSHKAVVQHVLKSMNKTTTYNTYPNVRTK